MKISTSCLYRWTGFLRLISEPVDNPGCLDAGSCFDDITSLVASMGSTPVMLTLKCSDENPIAYREQLDKHKQLERGTFLPQDFGSPIDNLTFSTET